MLPLREEVHSLGARLADLEKMREQPAVRMPFLWTLMLALGLLAEGDEGPGCGTLLEGRGRNLARNRPAFQSPMYQHPTNPEAAKAVDGNCDGVFLHGSCSHTTKRMFPWWFVDLGKSYYVTVVVVKNRADCCGDRLKGAVVYVGERRIHQLFNPLCGPIRDYNEGAVNVLYCHGLKGRYVSIYIPDRNVPLTLCEVEVYGIEAKPLWCP